MNETPEEIAPRLKEGSDYYIDERGMLVLTARYLLGRGTCCGNGCRHCPFGRSGEVSERVSGKVENSSRRMNFVPSRFIQNCDDG